MGSAVKSLEIDETHTTIKWSIPNRSVQTLKQKINDWYTLFDKTKLFSLKIVNQ